MGWLLVFVGLVVTNELARRSKKGGIFFFMLVPAALTVYFAAIYIGAARGAEWALTNQTYTNMNSWFHYAKPVSYTHLFAENFGEVQSPGALSDGKA